MTLFFIGLGLGNKKDITIKGLEAIKQCDLVYLENYTSILNEDVQNLEQFYDKKIILADRNLVENEADKILIKEKNVAFLVVGDVFGATTHTDLFLRAKEKNIPVVIINNTSIINAVGIVGLELYKYGKTTSIVFSELNWLPKTPYDVIKNNLSLGLHTLCLLDIKVKEPSKENLKEGKIESLPPRFMTINQGLKELLKLEQTHQENVIQENMLVIGVARLGQEDYLIKVGTITELLNYNFGGPLHSLIIPGKLHHIEEEMLTYWK